MELAIASQENRRNKKDDDGVADRRHSLGWTALMVAAANNQPEIVSELLRLGANPNLQVIHLYYT